MAALFVAAATFLVFLPALQNEFLIWDDDTLISDNLHIRSLDLNTVKWAFTHVGLTTWHPLIFLSFAVDYAVWGLDPWGFHLTNNILHALNALLVFFLVFRVVSLAMPEKNAEGFNEMPLIAGIVTALLFGLHPLRVEAVAWVTARKDLLYSFFYLLSMLAYLKYASSGSGKIKFYLASLILFAMSLMSKPMAVTLPAVLLILDYYPLKRIFPGMGWKSIKIVAAEKVPFFLLTVLMSLITIWTNVSADASTKLQQYSLLERVFAAMRGYLFFIYKMILPTDLIPYFTYPDNVNILSFEYMGAFVLFSAITILSIFLLKRDRVYLSAWLYYGMTLLPVIGILRIQGNFTRFTYLPCLGPFLLIGLAAGSIYKKTKRRDLRTALAIAVLLLIAIFADKTINQIRIWKDTITLWSYQIEHLPDRVPMAYTNRGIAYDKAGDVQKALADYDRSIKIDPKYVKPYNNRGVLYVSMKKYEEAMKDYNRAIELDPKLAQAYSNRGVAHGMLKDYEKTILDCSKAIEINPGIPDFYYNRGLAYGELKRYDEALNDFSMALKLNRGHSKAYNKRGDIYSRLAKHEEAIKDYSMAIQIDPGQSEPYFDRGNAYYRVENWNLALKDYNRVAEIAPNNATAYFNMGIIYTKLGENGKAISSFKRASSLGLKRAEDHLKRKNIN
ncbi:MAG: tetratricopeptide repeat protein [Thermodesulfovibrionia bacterium]|nr:tetratricopeptide repeat protein [Thermodesulfovibrionia bacterium]